MIVDTSAIMAIVLGEPESEAFLQKFTEATSYRISVGTWIELGVVVQRQHPEKAQIVENFLREAGVQYEPVSVEQAEVGRKGYKEFGQASGHKARLNFGDCFAYALAKVTGEPLLYKGNDFVHTDVRAA
jgi:ribonuclease VapC